MLDMGRQMACFGPFRKIVPVCPRATGGPRRPQVVPLPEINLSGRDRTANGLLALEHFWKLVQSVHGPKVVQGCGRWSHYQKST